MLQMNQATNGNVNGGGGASAELQAQLAEEKRKLQDAGMGKDAELAKLRAEMDAEKRRADGLQQQLDKALLKISQIEGAHTYLKPLLQNIHQNLAMVKRAQTSLVSEKEAMIAYGESLKGQGVGLQEKVAQVMESLEEKETRIKDMAEERRKLHNQVQELKGNIRVYCRVRPLKAIEAKDEPEAKPTVQMAEKCKCIIYNDEDSKAKLFEYDRCFSADEPQSAVFEEAAPLSTSVLDGYNVCIFAYGQTGSGKTHTMQGPPSDPGLNKLTVARLFELVHASKGDMTSQVQVYVTEIYNEQIRDLLAPGGAKKVDVRLNKKGDPEIPGLTEMQVNSTEEVMAAMELAWQNRKTSATDMNDQSSRSHCVVTVKAQTYIKASQTTYVGKLNLIDLAGSEDVSKSGVQGQELEEAKNINKSLSSLGDVIAALGQGKGGSHVPYRNSKLTLMLKDSLGGDCKTLMIANISPWQTSVVETLSTLKFAERSNRVELGRAVKNVA